MSLVASMRRTAFAALAALAALHGLWHGWYLPPQHTPLWLVLTVAWLPLLPVVLSWRAPRRALLLGGMACLFYFSHGVMEAWADPAARWPALLEVALSAWVVAALGVAVFAEKAQRRRAFAPRAALPRDDASG